MPRMLDISISSVEIVAMLFMMGVCERWYPRMILPVAAGAPVATGFGLLVMLLYASFVLGLPFAVIVKGIVPQAQVPFFDIMFSILFIRLSSYVRRLESAQKSGHISRKELLLILIIYVMLMIY